MGGFRIRLDLSDFVKDVGMHRVMFLPKEEILTIADLEQKIRGEYDQCTPDTNILLFIQDGFLIPSWEPIQVLQNDDKVKVVLKRNSKAKRNTPDESLSVVSKPKKIKLGENVKNQQSMSKNVEKVVKLSQKVAESSSSSSSSEDEQSKSKLILPKVFAKAAKAPSSSDDSSSSSEEEKTTKKPIEQSNKQTLQSKPAAKTRPVAISRGSSSGSDSSSVEEPTSKPLNPPAKLVKKDDSSSSSDSSDTDTEKQTKKSATYTVNKKSSSDDSSSEEEKTSTPIVSKATAAQNGPKNVSFAHSTAISTPEGNGEKPRRKRKRKNKNKNKLSASEMPTFEPMEVDVSNYREAKRVNERKVFGNEEPEPLSGTNTSFNGSTPVNEADVKEYKPSSFKGFKGPSTAEEFSAEDIQALYQMSQPSTIKIKLSDVNGKDNCDMSMSEVEKAILNQSSDESKVKSKTKPAIVFRPRVLNIQELKREKPVEKSVLESPVLSKVDKAEFSALLNSRDAAFTKDGAQTTDLNINKNSQKDYTQYHEVSQGGPRLHDVIAFKMIEMSENYTPELSEYKEGRVVQLQDDAVVFEIISQKIRKRTGRFELETEESAAAELEPPLQINWADVIQPRLIFP